jgi:gas vesicle protein
MAKSNAAKYNGYSVKDVRGKAGDVALATVSTLQAGLKKTRKNVGRVQGTVQDNAQSALPVAQGLLVTGLDIAQVAMERNLKRANKSLKKARKNLKNIQGSLQKSVQSSLEVAQDVLGKGTKTAGKVRKNVKGTQDSIQKRIERYQRRRARAKMLFRVGLFAGVVAALLFAPQPGSETRERLGGYWQQLAQLTQNVAERVRS